MGIATYIDSSPDILTAKPNDCNTAARRLNERGAAAPLELVVLAPLLMLMVVFVLWAGRGGRAQLVADLAAGEAAVAAAVCCEDGPSPQAQAQREAVVAQVLSARPSLDFLCIGGVRPAALENADGNDGGFVDEAWLERFDRELPGRTIGVGVLGVRLACDTDGAVAPLRGLLPRVSFYGQAAEVVAIDPRVLINIQQANSNCAGEEANVFKIEFSASSTQAVKINYRNLANEKLDGGGEVVWSSVDIGREDFIDREDYCWPIPIPSATVGVSLPGSTERVALFEFELQPSDPCAGDVPALYEPEVADARIDCDPDSNHYRTPVDLDGMPKSDYWKKQIGVQISGSTQSVNPEQLVDLEP